MEKDAAKYQAVVGGPGAGVGNPHGRRTLLERIGAWAPCCGGCFWQDLLAPCRFKRRRESWPHHLPHDQEGNACLVCPVGVWLRVTVRCRVISDRGSDEKGVMVGEDGISVTHTCTCQVERVLLCVPWIFVLSMCGDLVPCMAFISSNFTFSLTSLVSCVRTRSHACVCVWMVRDAAFRHDLHSLSRSGHCCTAAIFYD